jgi:hypothetical protein
MALVTSPPIFERSQSAESSSPYDTVPEASMTGERRSRPLPRVIAAGEVIDVGIDDEVMMR